MKWIDLFMIVLIVTIGVLGYKLHQSNNALTYTEEKIKYYEDELGRSRAEVTTLNTTLEALKQARMSLLDSVRANFDVELDRLRNITTTGLIRTERIEIPVYDTLVRVDTVESQAQAFRYNSKWLDMSGRLLDDQLSLSYTAYDSLSIVQERLRTGIKTQILSHNPNTRLRGVTSFEIEKKDRRFGLSVFAGPAVTLDGLTPLAVGVGVGWRVW